jgi:hypothetical protein
VDLSTDKVVKDSILRYEIEGINCNVTLNEVVENNLKEPNKYVDIVNLNISTNSPIYFIIRAHLSSGKTLEVY